MLDNIKKIYDLNPINRMMGEYSSMPVVVVEEAAEEPEQTPTEPEQTPTEPEQQTEETPTEGTPTEETPTEQPGE